MAGSNEVASSSSHDEDLSVPCFVSPRVGLPEDTKDAQMSYPF